MMEVNNKNENSLAISIPDAYLCLAILGAISSDSARNDVLSYHPRQESLDLYILDNGMYVVCNFPWSHHQYEPGCPPRQMRNNI